ncbi:hypothetical protein ABFB09_08670 [Dehalogenimonas sp. THU2]|uniref:hypothetical protein n=1 Tax=Dehalogenimonas sp. THU2 TaxID=3151121 RepID=UPI0032187771
MSVTRLASTMALIGGVLMIVFGGLGLIGSHFSGLFFGWRFSFGGIVTIVGGVIAVIGAKQAANLGWAIVLIIVGSIGGGLGGFLVLIGGIFGLVAALTHRP